MKRKLLILLSAVAFLTLCSGPTLAHHSSTAVYIQAKTIKIEGTLKEFLWRNPHSFIKVEAPDEKGEMQLWVIEGAAPTQLTESGMTRTTLRPGDHVVITGHPGRVAEDHRMVLLTLERPSDGWKLKSDRAALLENDGERSTK